MKKLFALLLVAGLFTVTSCGKTGGESAETKDTTAAPAVETPPAPVEEAPKGDTAKTGDHGKDAHGGAEHKEGGDKKDAHGGGH